MLLHQHLPNEEETHIVKTETTLNNVNSSNSSTADEDLAAERFRMKLRKIDNGVHYEEKYNIDEAINRRFGDIAKQVR